MTTLSVRLPAALDRNAKLFAERDGTSLNQLLATALAEKLAALGAEEVSQARAQRADLVAFQRAHAEVLDNAAKPGNEWP